jgi:TonB family protein
VVPAYLTYEVSHRPRWKTFAAGQIINLAGVLLLIFVGPRLTTIAPPKQVSETHFVTLVSPLTAPLMQPAKASVPALPKLAKLETPRVLPSPVELPKQRPLRAAPVRSAKAEPSKPEPFRVVASTAPAPKPAPPVVVKTNVFGAQGSELATVSKARREVQTGGFGDPNGLPGKGDPKRDTIAVASVGSFELPAGLGKGNGTGGSVGVSGIIRSAGFGDGVTSSGSHVRGNGTIQPSGFGSVVAQDDVPGSQRSQKKPDLEPVEIVYKPRPAYTVEARRLRVEGEVLLDVVFAANGSVHVNRVVKGLGYGLDDTALAAAQRMRFRPARRDGQPYDYAALVHMVFELAE